MAKNKRKLDVRNVSPTKLFTINNLNQSWKSAESKLKDAPFRDVIDYRDYHFFIDSKVRKLRSDILSVRWRPNFSVRVKSQKYKGINRILTYFHPEDLIVYELLCKYVHECFKKIYKKNAFFSRSAHEKSVGVLKIESEFFNEEYGGTFSQWKKFVSHRITLGRNSSHKYLVSVDVASFFDNIHHATIKSLVQQRVSELNIVNLLMLFLEYHIFRPNYSSHLRVGLPQDSFDCSRVLANLVLIRVDDYLQGSLRDEWARWMDDISFSCNSREEAYKHIGVISEMLREDGLSLNSGKTTVYNLRQVRTNMLVEENALIDKLYVNVEAGYIKSSKRALHSLWRKLKKDQNAQYWDQVVKRVFTLAGILKDPFLLSDSENFLLDYPKLHNNIFKYYESLDYKPIILNIIERYFGSGYDLYEEVRVRALECLTILEIPIKQRGRALDIGWKAYEDKVYKNDVYARANALLVIACYGNKNSLNKISRLYQSHKPEYYTAVIRRFMVAILLGSKYGQFHNLVLKSALSENNDLVKDIILFFSSMKIRTHWDEKTKSAFKLKKVGYSGRRVIDMRKILLLGMLTNHPSHSLRKSLLEAVKNEFNIEGIVGPRADSRLDELLFDIVNEKSSKCA